MDFATAFNLSWPFLAVCAVALALIWWTLQSALGKLRTTLDQVSAAQSKLGDKVGEIERRVEQIGSQQSDFTARMLACERSVQRAAQPPEREAEDDAGAASPESLERFDAATQTLSLLAQELNGFEARQSENWRRIKGDIDEQSFQLQRVQQHVDRLFNVPLGSTSTH